MRAWHIAICPMPTLGPLSRERLLPRPLSAHSGSRIEEPLPVPVPSEGGRRQRFSYRIFYRFFSYSIFAPSRKNNNCFRNRENGTGTKNKKKALGVVRKIQRMGVLENLFWELRTPLRLLRSEQSKFKKKYPQDTDVAHIFSTFCFCFFCFSRLK